MIVICFLVLIGNLDSFCWKGVLFAATTITTSSGTIFAELATGSTFPTHAMTSSSSNPVNNSHGVPEIQTGHSVILSLLDLKSAVLSTLSPNEIFPTIDSVADVSMETSSSLNPVSVDNRAVGTDATLSAMEVVVIATGVALLSLATVVISIALTFLIRRRTRQKAYLRVRHASQAELCVHYVQNTAASVAARDAAMEQLFQSLASIDPDIQTPDYNDSPTDGERCMSPTDSIASTGFIGTKTKPHSRSLPSLKNLCAHEEALSCTLTGRVFGANSGKLGARSRSLTERAALGVDLTGTKSATRSHSEKLLKNRLVLLPAAAAKCFEKKGRNKSIGRHTPSFSRLVKFGVFGGPSTKRKSEKESVPCVVESHGGARTVAAAAAPDRRRSSTSLLDFKVPSMSSIMQDIGPMLTAFQCANEPATDQLSVQSGSPSPGDNTQNSDKPMYSHSGKNEEEEDDDNGQYNNGRCNSHITLQPEIQNSKINRNSDTTIYIDDKLEASGPNKQKVPSFEEVRNNYYLHGSSSKTTKGVVFSSVGHLETSCKERAVGDHIKQTIS